MHKIFFLFFLTVFSQLSFAVPYLWETNTSGIVLANMQLKNSSGASFSMNITTTSVALSSSSKAYIVGSGDIKPYLWISDALGSIEASVELKNSSGASFIGGSTSNVALSSSSKAYIVGSGDDAPYLWVSDALGSIETSVELKNSSGTSFSMNGSTSNVALSSSSKAYIVGMGDYKPYLWIASSSGSIETSVELKSSSGASFSSGSTSSIALSSSGKAYIVGTGDNKPYLWVASSSGSIETSVELLSNSGDAFQEGLTTSLAINTSGVIYIIGTTKFNSISIPYLWIANDSNSAISSIELKNSNNHSFIQGASVAQITTLASKAYIVGSSKGSTYIGSLPYLWIVNTPSFISNIELRNSQGSSFIGGTLSDIAMNSLSSQPELLVSTTTKLPGIKPLKGVRKASGNPLIIYITGNNITPL